MYNFRGGVLYLINNRGGAVLLAVKFCKPEKGIMGIQLDGSLEWTPMHFVNDKYFAVDIDVSDKLALSIRQKQEQNFRLISKI